jgi:SAM-dependent methyltransferase
MSDSSDWYTSDGYDKVAISAQGGLAGRIFHSQIERGISSNDHYSKVLEIGALSGQHLPYVRHTFDTWTLSDIIDHPTGEFDDSRIVFERQDAHALSFNDHSFDRVAAMCVAHHLDQPMLALTEMRRVCRPGGILTIFLPVEPGWSYNLAIHLTSIRRARRLGLEEEALRSRALQHRNHFDSLRWQFNEVFKRDQVRTFSWPLPFGGKYLNMFTSWHVVRSEQD